jgi:triosephosphate isomerase
LPDEIDWMNLFIRRWLYENISEDISKQIRIIYGGQVDETNVAKLIMMKNVDGFLLNESSIQP